MKWKIITLTLSIIVVGILVLPHSVVRISSDDRVKMTSYLLEALNSSIMLYIKDTGDCLSNAYGLRALIQKPENVDRWSGPYLKKLKIPVDAWEHELLYKYVGNECSLISLGADGKIGGTGENTDIQITLKVPLNKSEGRRYD